MHSPFGKLVMAALARKGWSQREFAEQLGITQVFVAQVVTDKAVMPIKRIEQWAETLQIPARDRKQFELLGAVTLCPLAYQIEIENLLIKSRSSRTRKKTSQVQG